VKEESNPRGECPPRKQIRSIDPMTKKGKGKKNEGKKQRKKDDSCNKEESHS
jgi:hypothetical protein